MSGWIGVDLDGTLAEYHPGSFSSDSVGKPIPLMVERVKAWLAEGKEVRIFTARADEPENLPAVDAWVRKHIGQPLKITNVKDMGMVELWDDRAVQVVRNEGIRVGYSTRGHD